MKLFSKVNILWWLNPVAAVLMALVPFIISAHYLTGPDYFELWRTEKHLDNSTALLCLAVVGSFLAGAFCHFFFRKKKPPVPLEIDYSRLEIVFLCSITATILGYVFWALVCYTHGVGVAQVIAVFRGDTGAVYAIRDLGSTIPGVTTATQFGMASAILGAILWNRRHQKYVLALLVLLVLMAMFRALLWSERLATIEVVIPLIITLFGKRDWQAKPRLRWVLFAAPILACSTLYFYFTISEYFRSWGHYSEGGDSLWYFSWMRLCGYYITALNNGALMHKVLGTLPFPYAALETFWKFPGVSLLFPYYDVFSVDPDAYMDSLKSMANPEFNNPSGIFPYVCDFGTVGACVFWFLVGWGTTTAYSAFRRGSLWGVLCFPLLYVSFLEVCRIPYLTSSRTLPSWGMLLIASLILKQRRNWRASNFQKRTSARSGLVQKIPARR